MIQIDDDDLPITVAEKIINGTKPYNAAETWRTLAKAITGTDCDTSVMFDLEEIKEIADYLIVYYESHKERNREIEACTPLPKIYKAGNEVEDGN